MDDEASLKEEDDESYSFKLMGDRGGTLRSKNVPSSSGNSSNNNRSVSGRGQAAAVLDEEEEEDMGDEKEDVVTPYSI
jgi:hypothetical protein